jgi:hypothetical protein
VLKRVRLQAPSLRLEKEGVGDGASPSKEFPFALGDSDLGVWIACGLGPRLARGGGSRTSAAEEGAEAEVLGYEYDVSDLGEVPYDPDLGYEMAMRA